MEGWVERAFFYAEQVVGCALDVKDDSVAVQCAVVGQRLEDEEIECSLKIVFRHFFTPSCLGIEKSRHRRQGVSRGARSRFTVMTARTTELVARCLARRRDRTLMAVGRGMG